MSAKILSMIHLQKALPQISRMTSKSKEYVLLIRYGLSNSGQWTHIIKVFLYFCLNRKLNGWYSNILQN